VMLRKNTRGYILSCTNYSSRHRCAFTVWLPRGSQSVSVSPDEASVCTDCSTQGAVRKVSFVWKPGAVPPHLGRESTACLLCDARFRQDVQVQLPQMDQVSSNNRQRQGGGSGTNRTTSNNGRGGGGTSSNNRASNSNNHRSRTANSSSSDSNSQVCFKCNQPGHYANSCPTRRQ
jgi:Zinc knuckle